jgi:hypothetical protein
VTIRSRTSAVYDTAASSFSVAMPAGVQTGDRLLVFFVNDNATNVATTTSTGWSTDPTWRVQEGTSTNLAARLFTKVATASNSLTIDTTESQEAAVVVVALQGDGGTPTVLTAAMGATTGSPAEIVVPVWTGSSGNYDSIVFLGLDANPPTVQSPALTLGDGGYGTRTNAEPGGSGSLVGAYEWDKAVVGATSIDPGTATWANEEQSIAFHVVVPQVSAGPVEKAGSDSGTGSPGSGGVTGTSTGSDTATGADAGSIALPGSDAGTGAETGYVSEGKIGGDSGTGAEVYDSTGVITEDDTATGAEGWASTADLSPPVDEAGTAESGFIGIPGSDEALGVDAHDAPTDVTVTTGEGATGRDGGYVETLYGNLVVSLYAIDAETGAYAALPDYESLDFSRERNSRGAVRMSYPANGQGFELLRSAVTANRDLEFELWTSGTPIGALRGYLQEGRGDDVAEDAVWDFAGAFQELRTDEAVIYPQDPGELIVDPDTGESEYSNAAREFIVNADTPGAVLITLMQQAHARGALDDITWDFTLTHDSNGTPWADLLSAKFSPGVTYTQILDKLVDLGLAEWAVEWSGTERVLKLWVGGGRGADRTVGPRPVILRKGRNLLDAPRSWSLRDAGTTVLAAGDEAIYAEAEDATALARRDRRIERFVSLQNAADDEAVLAFAQAELSTLVEGITSVDHGIGMLPGEPRPIIAFDIGDWVYSQSGIELERLRVVQWNVSIDNERQLSGTVTLNDTMADAVEKLRKRLDAIQSGEAVVGTSEPGANVVDRTPPAAPQGVVASSIAYQDPAAGPGQTLAQVSVGWLPVTTNADGADNPLVQAAVFILDKIEEEILNPEEPDPDQEDGGPNYDPIDMSTWTWKNCPQLVQDFAAPLRALWVEDGSPDEQTWLADYIAETTQTPTAADDVAGYEVRYAYLGLDQVGGLPTSDPFPEDERFYYLATPPSGTSGTSYSFGGVEGGSHLRIEVRAFDRAGNFGAWTTVLHDASNDTTPPPTPSAPVGLKTWFRTLDVPWDGLGAEGEVMPIDFSHARVWVGQGADLTLPAEPVVGPVAFDPLETGPQYVANLYASGTWNVPDIPIGPGWYAALQTVDHTGNASPRGAVAGPVFAQQLVGQDLIDDIIDATKLGPNSVQTLHIVDAALTSAKIQDAAIIRAKIADLAVNDAKIETLSVGKITAGTMNATVVIGGQFRTDLSSTANRIEFDSAGIRLYQGTTVIGNWQVVDGSMLVTGTYRSGLSGARIQINPNGTMEMYPPTGTNKSTISNEGSDIVWRGPLTGSKSGRLNVNTLGVGLNYSQEGNLLGSITSELVVLDKRMRLQAPLVQFVADGDYDTHDGSDHRVQFSATDSSGNTLSNSIVSYMPSEGSNSNRGALVGNTVGLVFMGGGGQSARLEVRHATSGWGSWLNVHATSLVAESSGTVKSGIEDIRTVLDPLETIRSARARTFVQETAPTDEPRVGVIAEELPEIIVNHDTGTPGVDVVQQVGVLWGAFNQVLDQEIVSTSGTAVVLRSQVAVGGIWAPGVSVEVPITWESTPPAPPTGGFVQINSAFIWAGKIAGWIKTGSTTETGCVVIFKNVSNANVVINETQDNLRVSATAIGLGLYTPPYVPEEG